MVKGVVFDLGDTLVTQEPLVGGDASYIGARNIEPLLAEYALTVPDSDQVADYIGEALLDAVVKSYDGSLAQPDVHEVFNEVLARFECQLPAGVIDRVMDAYFAPYYERMENIGEVVPTLTFARALGLKLGLLANVLWGEEMLYKRLTSLGIVQFMNATSFSSQLGWLKPYPSTFTGILSRMGLEPNEVIMVGDDLVTDIEGAHNIGMGCVWMNRGEVSGGAHSELAALEIHDIRQLLPAVAEMMQ